MEFVRYYLEKYCNRTEKKTLCGYSVFVSQSKSLTKFLPILPDSTFHALCKYYLRQKSVSLSAQILSAVQTIHASRDLGGYGTSGNI